MFFELHEPITREQLQPGSLSSTTREEREREPKKIFSKGIENFVHVCCECSEHVVTIFFNRLQSKCKLKLIKENSINFDSQLEIVVCVTFLDVHQMKHEVQC